MTDYCTDVYVSCVCHAFLIKNYELKILNVCYASASVLSITWPIAQYLSIRFVILT